jgi:hypothetical protein
MPPATPPVDHRKGGEDYGRSLVGRWSGRGTDRAWGAGGSHPTPARWEREGDSPVKRQVSRLSTRMAELAGPSPDAESGGLGRRQEGSHIKKRGGMRTIRARFRLSIRGLAVTAALGLWAASAFAELSMSPMRGSSHALKGTCLMRCRQ